jgi:hypothetical protein
MESKDNTVEYKQLLIIYFPTVIANLILTYMPLYNLQYIESINYAVDDFILFFDKNICVRSFKNNTICVNGEIYKIPLDNSPRCFVNKKIVLLEDNKTYKYKLFNIDTLKIIKNIDFYGYFCSINDKYIIFRNNGCIELYNIETMELELNINTGYEVTSEIGIINGIIYITVHNDPHILRYTMSGKDIGKLSFEFLRNVWKRSFISILKFEIIIAYNNTITYYDLNGIKLKELNMSRNINGTPYMTPDYVFIQNVDKQQIHKYKRVI